MKLDSKQAKKLLEKAAEKEENRGWVKHCIAVGETAKTIAEALNKKGMEIDTDKILAMGYVHDIGKQGGQYNEHVLDGYFYIKELGYDEEYASSCLIHSYINNDINCTGGGYQKNIPFRTNYVKNHNYTIYDRIINLSDLMCTRETITVEDRMIDIFERKGIHETSKYHITALYKLKESLEDILGYNIYELFENTKGKSNNKEKLIKIIENSGIIQKERNDYMEKAKVYFTKEITAESLIKIYEALNINLTGKVGVKVSTGEQGAKGYLKADLIGPLVKHLNGTIIECNTAYPGKRNTFEEHMKVAEEHGFTSFAEVDIMDAKGEFKIPVNKGKHLKYDIIGENFKNYDSILNLAHGKGHMMGGFGANLKNQSIGIASRNGKAYIHSCGQDENPDTAWDRPYEQIEFIESMAEAATAVSDYLKEEGKPIAYITVMNALSVDCDCDKNQGDPVMKDIGIVASLDPVANDQAFIDMVWNSDDEGAHLLQERIDSREGREILPYAESLGLGTREYELINID